MKRYAILIFCALAMSLPGLSGALAGEWFAAAESGCRLWHPSPREGQQVRWSGRCVNGKAQGDGVAEWFVHPAVTDRCECTFVDGKADGQGTFRWADGIIYAGEFRAGNIEGNGYIRYPDNEIYEGEFRNGLPNGWGVQILPDNTRVMGRFKDGAHVVTD